MVGFPDSDEEELVRNAVLQAQDMGRRIVRALSRSPAESRESTAEAPSLSPSPSPAPPSGTLAVRSRGASRASQSPPLLVPPPAVFTQPKLAEPSASIESIEAGVTVFTRFRKGDSNHSFSFIITVV